MVRELAPAAHNPRVISEKRHAQLGKTMTKFGDLSGITYNRRTGRLITGHQRVKHLQQNAKIERKAKTDETGTVAVGSIGKWSYREVDWDEKTEKAACIAANAAGGHFDEAKLDKLVKELDGSGFDMDLCGLDNLEDILGADSGAAAGADDAPAASVKAIAKRGEVWILGDHRLICGDSTSRDDVQKLMGHDRAAMVFTDPPYGVSYDSEGNDFEVIKGDHKRDDELYALVAGALKQATHFAENTAAFYVWHASSTRREFEDALRDAGLSERQYIIWVKNALVMGRADYHWSHEPCFYAAKSGQQPAWHGDRAQPTVWRITLKKRAGQATTLGQALVLTDGAGGSLALTPRLAKGKKTRTARLEKGASIAVEIASEAADVWEVGRDHGADYVHPTQKPIELARIALVNSSKPGQIVLDLFGGSGTTLMAAELTGRHARLCELDPKYVDAIVKRWQDVTGRKAERE